MTDASASYSGSSITVSALLHGILCPALLLSSSGSVIESSNAFQRLSPGPKRSATGPNIEVNRGSLSHINSLEIALLPSTKSVYRTWDSLLSNLAANLSRNLPHREQLVAGNDTQGLQQDGTDQFWDVEDSNVESVSHTTNVLVTCRPQPAYGVHQSPFDIKAQMHVQAILLQDSIFHLVTFERPKTLLDLPTPPKALTPPDEELLLPSYNTSRIDEEDFDIPYVDFLANPKKDVHQYIGGLTPNLRAVLDPDGQVRYLSPSWYTFSGITKKQSLGSAWAGTIHPDDFPAMMDDWASVIATGRGHWTYIARCLGYDGMYIYFLIHAQPLRDKHGNIVKWFLSMMDINELVLAKRESERRTKSILKVLSLVDVSLWDLSKGGDLRLHAGTLSWETDEARRAERIKEEIYKLKEVQNVLEGKELLQMVKHQVGEKFYRTSLIGDTYHKTSCGPEKQVLGIFGLTVDITDIHARAILQHDDEQQAFNEQTAKESNKLKTWFISNMSHEIRTPISGVIGLNNILLETNLDDEQRELLRSSQLSANYLLTLINDILDFNKIESGHMDIEQVPFNLETLIADVIKIISVHVVKKGLVIHQNLSIISPHLLGDPQRIQQVLINLFSNATKFTKRGSINLTTEEVSSTESSDMFQDRPILDPLKNLPSTTTESIFSRKCTVKFTIIDTGTGIDAVDIPKLFTRFQQGENSTARNYGGTGLGLSMCKQLVELMGGTIELFSRRHKGTTVSFQIPFQVTDPDSSTETLNQSTPPSSTSPYPNISLSLSSSPTEPKKPIKRIGHILIVEDNAINQTIAVTMAQKLGYTTSATWNGAEALDYLAEPSNKLPDLILMDCMMPIMDGYETTRILRSGFLKHGTSTVQGEGSEIKDTALPLQIRTIPIIALTASAIKGEREKCSDAGMDDFLTKPIVRERLGSMIRKWLRKRRAEKKLAEGLFELTEDL